MSKPYRIGILGASGIAPAAIIQPAARRDDCQVVAVAARDRERARSYADEHGIAEVAESYAALLARGDLDLVFNGLMNDRHADLSIAAMEAGMDVLCEKPVAMNAGEARRMADAAARTGRTLIEGFHYRFHPAFAELQTALASIGPLTFARGVFTAPIPPSSTRFVLALGGGALMDLGCYPLHALRTLTGVEPEVVSAIAEQDGPAGIDTLMAARMRFGEMEAEIVCDMGADAPRGMRLELDGRDGHITMTDFVHPHRGCAVTVNGQTTPYAPTELSTYDHQLAHVVAVMRGEVEPLTGGADAVANMAAIDDIYRAAGMTPRGL